MIRTSIITVSYNSAATIRDTIDSVLRTFFKRALYEKYGKFDWQFKLSADFDLILRLLGVHKVLFEYIPEVLVKMRIGGKNTGSIKMILIMNGEDPHSVRSMEFEPTYSKSIQNT
jgi:hypothetical protein